MKKNSMMSMMVLMVCCAFVVGVQAGPIVLTNDCSSNDEFTPLGDEYGTIDIMDQTHPSFGGDVASGGAVDSGPFIWNVSDSYNSIVRWDKAGAGLNLQVTTADTLSFYLHSYWNAAYNPEQLRVDLWFSGDSAPVTIAGPGPMGNLTTWTQYTYNMPKDGTLVAVDWGVPERYKFFYFDQIQVTGVPEPTMIALLGVGLLGKLRRRS